jgi:NitT/TauT family transport system substrate-binding protein
MMAAFVAASSVAVGNATAQTPEKFTFALNWFAVGDHAAYWVALDKGYFTQRGLDVTLENSKGSGDSIAKVDTGRADAGLADTAVVIAALARTAKIRIVGMVFDKTPLNVFSSKDKPIPQAEGSGGQDDCGAAGRQPAPGLARLRQGQSDR